MSDETFWGEGGESDQSGHEIALSFPRNPVSNLKMRRSWVGGVGGKKMELMGEMGYPIHKYK